jgi:hypothetical protein
LIAEAPFVVPVVVRPTASELHLEEAVVVELLVLEMLMVVRLYFLDLILVVEEAPVKTVLEVAPTEVEEDVLEISDCMDHNHHLVFASNLLEAEAAQRVPCCE